MSNKVKPPISTLRGHVTGVTALYSIPNANTLLSGDEEGKIIVWDLSIFRKLTELPKFGDSRVQTLRVVKLTVNHEPKDVLIAQYRNEGVFIVTLNLEEPKILAKHPVYESLFSKGDAISICDNMKAILAYPAYLENYLVTVRILGEDAQTLISGTAKRNSLQITIFDIKVLSLEERHLIFVGYEDGCICMYSFVMTETTPLTIDLIKTVDLGTKDFVSAFDVMMKNNKIIAVCGSPLGELKFVDISTDSIDAVKLKKHGVAAISIRQDKRLVAVSCWDETIRLYSTKSMKPLAVLKHHLSQVQDLLFFETSNVSDGESKVEYLLCCASLEGTISISKIY